MAGWIWSVLRVGPNMFLQGGPECKFSDVSAEWGFDQGDRWSTAFSATWEPGQDWPTLAIGNYVDRKNADGPFEACDVNELYRPQGQGYATPEELKPGFLRAVDADFGLETRWGARPAHFQRPAILCARRAMNRCGT